MGERLATASRGRGPVDGDDPRRTRHRARPLGARAGPPARERVLLFNVVTLTTLAIGIGALYVVLFVVLGLAAVIAIRPGAIERQLDTAPGPVDYARLAWFAASVATVGGALGSLVESDDAVRDAAYRRQAGTPAE